MELPVSLQLRELELALALGAGLAAVYTLLGLLRRGPVSTVAADLLYCLAVFLSLLAFGLYAGRGRLRLFALLAMGLSGSLGLYLRQIARKVLEKNRKKQKKTVAFAEKSATIV